MKKLLMTVPVMAMMLTACGGESYTTDFLYKNPTKRYEILDSCKQNKEKDTNCANANTAQATYQLEVGNKKRQINQLQAEIQQANYIKKRFPAGRTTGQGNQAGDARLQAKQDQLEKLKAELNTLVAEQARH